MGVYPLRKAQCDFGNHKFRNRNREMGSLEWPFSITAVHNQNWRESIMSLSVLSLLYLLQVWPSSSQFVFEFELVSVDTIDYQICDDLQVGALNADQFGPCEPFLQIFCLREGRDNQSTNTGDCPLGSSTAEIIAFTPSDVKRDSETRPGLPDGPVNRTISSQEPWPVRHINSCILLNRLPIILSLQGTFQLYIEARELSPPSSNDPLDNIFINRTLEVNADFTPIERYNGTSMLNRVVLDMRFSRVSNRKYEGMQNHSAAAFSSRTHLGKLQITL